MSLHYPSLVEAVLTDVEEVRAKARVFVDTIWQRYSLTTAAWNYGKDYLYTEVSQLLQDHEMEILKRNAPPTPDARIELPFMRTDDPEITCIYCRMPGVEYGLLVRRPGERSLIGLHERCRREAVPSTSPTDAKSES